MDGIIKSKDMSLSQLWEIVKDGEAWRATVHGVTKSWTELKNKEVLVTDIIQRLKKRNASKMTM